MTWPKLLPQEAMAHAGRLMGRAAQERQSGRRICPAQENLFRALDLTPPDGLKVCIVGQRRSHCGYMERS